MNDDNLEKALISIENEILSDLRKDLEKELKKPSGERDEDFIAELKDMISATENEVINDSREKSLESVMKMLDGNNKKSVSHRIIRLVKNISAVSAVLCLMFVLGQNSRFMNAFSGKPLPEECEISGNFVVINDVYDEGWQTDDPYGIKAECAKYDMFPIAPSYLPDDFELDHVSYSDEGVGQNIRFVYKKKISFLKTQL